MNQFSTKLYHWPKEIAIKVEISSGANQMGPTERSNIGQIIMCQGLLFCVYLGLFVRRGIVDHFKMWNNQIRIWKTCSFFLLWTGKSLYGAQGLYSILLIDWVLLNERELFSISLFYAFGIWYPLYTPCILLYPAV